ncbi:MAG TPA: IS3 family transposase [Virgibacillus sp.]|nr:IS3 family transposase [Virgibacillus sp.]HLR68936.1 IS3 family transposase [Virgibacillus sp.]
MKINISQFKELHESEELSIVLLCDIAGISRAAYYKWLKRIPSSRELQNEEIIREMKILHEKVEGIYGYRRMKLNINRKFGQNFNHKRIYRLMNVAENILNRKFTAEKPNKKWVTDVTEFKYSTSKKAYLSAIVYGSLKLNHHRT